MQQNSGFKAQAEFNARAKLKLTDFSEAGGCQMSTDRIFVKSYPPPKQTKHLQRKQTQNFRTSA
jgi:hypothetical protein